MNSNTAKRLAALRKTANVQYDAGDKAAHLVTMGKIREITTAQADKFCAKVARSLV